MRLRTPDVPQLRDRARKTEESGSVLWIPPGNLAWAGLRPLGQMERPGQLAPASRILPAPPHCTCAAGSTSHAPPADPGVGSGATGGDGAQGDSGLTEQSLAKSPAHPHPQPLPRELGWTAAASEEPSLASSHPFRPPGRSRLPGPAPAQAVAGYPAAMPGGCGAAHGARPAFHPGGFFSTPPRPPRVRVAPIGPTRGLAP